MINFDIVLIFTQNIDRGSTLEPPRTNNFIWNKITKKNQQKNKQFKYIKVGFK